MTLPVASLLARELSLFSSFWSSTLLGSCQSLGPDLGLGLSFSYLKSLSRRLWDGYLPSWSPKWAICSVPTKLGS